MDSDMRAITEWEAMQILWWNSFNHHEYNLKESPIYIIINKPVKCFQLIDESILSSMKVLWQYLLVKDDFKLPFSEVAP